VGADRDAADGDAPRRAGHRSVPARAFRTARAAEVVYWIPRHRAVVPGDVLLGDGEGGVRLCPESWMPAKKTLDDLAESLRPLLELPVERVLVSHGEPVLRGGTSALAAALDGP
jgi:glyoxylase-like metal-dependent hydrolase (beta-lactamase superfamily II)